MPQTENKILANRLRSIAAELIGISKNVEQEHIAPTAKPLVLEIFEGAARDFELAAYAEGLYQDRRRRSRYFPENLFAEPAWDILLDLFVNGVRNRAISITSACIAGGIPATTGLRWLGVLEKEGLLIREISAEDARVTLVQLSDYGMKVMRSYIADASGLHALAADEAAAAG